MFNDSVHTACASSFKHLSKSCYNLVLVNNIYTSDKTRGGGIDNELIFDSKLPLCNMACTTCRTKVLQMYVNYTSLKASDCKVVL